MKTDELIDALVVDGDRRPPPGWKKAVPVVAGLVASLVVFAVWFGVRADFAEAVQTPRFILKLGLLALLAGVAGVHSARLAAPDGSAGTRTGVLLVVPLAVLGVAIFLELLVSPPATWAALAIGSNAVRCMTLVPLLSAAPLFGLLWAMRSAAPNRPALSGAALGLLAAALGAFLYGTMCPDDSPLFVATWYPIGTLAVVALGALAGRWLLRW
jgi:hypothetical protein